MRCRDCPYGIESFEKYESYIDEEDIENCVWCDKVGGKVQFFGYCSDYEQYETDHKKYSKKKRMNKYERYLKHQNHLKYLERVSGGYAVTYEDEVWIKCVGHIKNPKPYYKRWYRGKRSSYLKRQSNKAIRRYKGELHNGYQHIHKIFDFWWEYS